MATEIDNQPVGASAVGDIIKSSLALATVKGYMNPADKLFYEDEFFVTLLTSSKRAIHYDLLTQMNYAWNKQQNIFIPIAVSKNDYSDDEKAFVDRLKTCVPSDASSANPLVTMNNLDDYTERELSYDIDGNPFPTYQALTSATEFYYAGEKTTPMNWDFTLVQQDETHNGTQSRFSYRIIDDAGAWVFNYTFGLSLSIDQLEAINSTITKAKVDSYDSHIKNEENPHKVTKDQIGLSNVINTGDSDTPEVDGTDKFTTGGAYKLRVDINSALNKITTVTDQITSLETRVTDLNNLLASLDAKVTTLSDQVTSLDASVTTINDQITSLDARVTALENK